MVNGERPQVNGLSQAAIGRAMNLAPATMTKLKKQGMPVDSLEGALRWRTERQNIAQRKAAPPSVAAAAQSAPAQPPAPPAEYVNGESHDAARTRREIAEANLAELKLLELRGDLVRASAVRDAAAKRYAGLRDSLLQLPARVVPLLVASPDASTMEKLLRIEIVAALEQLTTRAE